MAPIGQWPFFKRIDKPIFDEKKKKFFIAGSPGYGGGSDPEHYSHLTKENVDFLRQKGIDGVYSWNNWPIKDSEQLLFKPDVDYDQGDTKTDKLKSGLKFEMFEPFYKFFLAHNKTLLTFSKGDDWRNDMATAVLQLGLTKGKNPPESKWKDMGIKESDRDLLRKWKKKVIADAAAAGDDDDADDADGDDN
ncbi:hypothetical protein EYR40_007534 [Pleurotus pulmonarius]|nr:hypothetical protein EYR36_008375 [Pleurotus pulmonarius]KAF4579862.1 hypothetical protein EYR36_001682 [Pleurotus pulmonarius]KAF4596777.1 hypothetical protein EYR38_008168 [Pleurotus pulmonarius]KAF4597084.1 hypothetical protein EYR40_007534 [Pleurotus pulmonarius]